MNGIQRCKWCGDRPGGCLYCIDRRDDLMPEEKLQALNTMILEGEVHVIAYRNEILVRPVRAGRREKKREVQPAACVCHDWEYDVTNKMRRRCRRPGCGIIQVFRFLPASPDVTGEWVSPGEIEVPEHKPSRRKRA